PEDAGERTRIAEQAGRLRFQLAPAGGGQSIVARAAVVLGDCPARVDHLAFLESDERVVEGPVFDGERAACPVLEPRRDLEAVHGAKAQGTENECVERAAQQRRLVGHASPKSSGEILGGRWARPWFQSMALRDGQVRL